MRGWIGKVQKNCNFIVINFDPAWLNEYSCVPFLRAHRSDEKWLPFHQNSNSGALIWGAMSQKILTKAARAAVLIWNALSLEVSVIEKCFRDARCFLEPFWLRDICHRTMLSCRLWQKLSGIVGDKIKHLPQFSRCPSAKRSLQRQEESLHTIASSRCWEPNERSRRV